MKNIDTRSVTNENILVFDTTDRIYKDLTSTLPKTFSVLHEDNNKNLFNAIRNNAITVLIINLTSIDYKINDLLQWKKNHATSFEYIIVTKKPSEKEITQYITQGAFECIENYTSCEYISCIVLRASEKNRSSSEIHKLHEILHAQSLELIKEKDLKVSLLYEASKITGSVFNLETLFKMIVLLITYTMKVKICSLMLINDATGELEIKEAAGLQQNIIDSTSIKVGEGVSGWVLAEGKSLLISNIADDGRFKERNKERYLTSSLLCVPLKIKDTVIGVLNINNKINEKPFNEEDRKILEPLAFQIASVIDNAQLIEHLMHAKTEVKKTHEQLIRSEKFAAIGKLAANLSHEINNPLTSIYGRVQQLMRSATDENTTKILTVVKSEVERISRILNNLLNFAKINKTKTQLSDINHVIDNSLNLLTADLKKGNISLYKRYDTDIPKIQIDGDQFMQVVINIILNAVKAMSSGGDLTITTHQNDFLDIEFKDTGVGVDKKDIENIFEPFYTKWEVGSGTGLGLAVSKNIIENFGGELCVHSKIGVGTTFTIKLPCN